MPKYEFECDCGRITEVTKIMGEGEVLRKCDKCGKPVKKVFTADGQTGNVSGGTPIHYAR